MGNNEVHYLNSMSFWLKMTGLERKMGLAADKVVDDMFSALEFDRVTSEYQKELAETVFKMTAKNGAVRTVRASRNGGEKGGFGTP